MQLTAPWLYRWACRRAWPSWWRPTASRTPMLHRSPCQQRWVPLRLHDRLAAIQAVGQLGWQAAGSGAPQRQAPTASRHPAGCSLLAQPSRSSRALHAAPLCCADLPRLQAGAWGGIPGGGLRFGSSHNPGERAAFFGDLLCCRACLQGQLRGQEPSQLPMAGLLHCGSLLWPAAPARHLLSASAGPRNTACHPPCCCHLAQHATHNPCPHTHPVPHALQPASHPRPA